MGNSRNSFIVVSIFIYLLLSLPFMFSATLLDNHNAPIKLLIVMLLFPQTLYVKNSIRSVKVYMMVFVIYFLLISILRSDYFVNAFLLALDVFFFWECVKLLSNDGLYQSVKKRYIQFSTIIACFVVVAAFAYKFLPSIFSYTEINDYKSYFNPLLGLINGEKERPCWYFAEPSYCGFFLGVSFLFLYSSANYSRQQKILITILFALAIFFCASLGTYIYMFITLLLSLFVKRFKRTLPLEVILYGSIIFVLVVIPQIEELQVLQYFDMETNATSFIDRQERIEMANSIMNNMSFVDKLFGCGINYAAEKYEIGLSDAYHKMFCEYGIFYLLLFLLVVRKLTKDNFTTYMFILLSFFSVIIHDSPIMLLTYLLIYKQTRYLHKKKIVK